MYVSGINDHHNVFVNLVVMMYYCILQLGLALKGISSPHTHTHTFYLYILFCIFFFLNFLHPSSYCKTSYTVLLTLYVFIILCAAGIIIFTPGFFFPSLPSQNIWDDAFFFFFFKVYYLKKKKT